MHCVNGCICLNIPIFIQILLNCRKGDKTEIHYRKPIVKHKNFLVRPNFVKMYFLLHSGIFIINGLINSLVF